jgi:DNA-binding NtrC family response regulator
MSMPKKNSILIIDEEAAIRKFWQTYFSEDYSCSIAANVDEATSLLAEKSFNLVVTDMLSEGRRGLELLDFLRQYCPGTSILVVSAMDKDCLREAISHGTLDGHTKSVELSNLMKLVERAISYQVFVRRMH